MGKQIPDRWLDYRKIGDVVADSNFVAFKVPLHKVSSMDISFDYIGYSLPLGPGLFSHYT